MADKQEIVEKGIHQIEIEVPALSTRSYQPYQGQAKWFKDDLEQLWVKFTTTLSSSTVKIEHVIPASRVVEVSYKKAAGSRAKTRTPSASDV